MWNPTGAQMIIKEIIDQGSDRGGEKDRQNQNTKGPWKMAHVVR